MASGNASLYLFLKTKMEPKTMSLKDKGVSVIRVLLFSETQKSIAIV